MTWRAWGSNLRCRLNIHCDHTVDEDHVHRIAHHGRTYENVTIYQVECCRCDRVDFGEKQPYGYPDVRQADEPREKPELEGEDR